MKTKLTLLLSLTFLFLFSGSSIVFAADERLQAVITFYRGKEAYDRKDYKTAFRLWQPLAEQRFERAQYNLGKMYNQGLGVPQDDVLALMWWNIAGSNGYKDAVTNRNFLEKKMPPSQIAEAQFNLGVRYYKGKGVPQDDKEAVKWYRLSAEQGFEKAQYILGFMYHKGLGVSQDYKKAVKWYRLSAEQGNTKAQNNLGMMYVNGQGVLQNNKEAVRLYRIAAEQGNANAQNNLGRMYNQGLGVPKDLKEAVRLFRLSVEQGDVYGQFNLGLMCHEGKGVPQDYKEAVRLYRLSAEQGNAKAQLNLGFMYHKGQGVPQDNVSAYMWWNICASSGERVCVEKRDFIEKKMSPEQIVQAEEMERKRKLEHLKRVLGFLRNSWDL
jgi:uncharacterized protein